MSRLPMQLSWSPPPQLRAAQHAALELDRRTGLICSTGAEEGPGSFGGGVPSRCSRLAVDDLDHARLPAGRF
eukprot:COSAG01_NODE_58121_length_308_cov_0.540670_1_plen_71_part_01